MIEITRKRGPWKHGATANGKVTRTYRSWADMTKRCTNPKNKCWDKYGGRGIKVCARWRSFENFLADMGERPAGYSLERKNNNGGYSKRNCKWATQKEQVRNRAVTFMFTYKGKTKALAQWAEELGVEYEFLRGRIRNGWSMEDALKLRLGQQRGRKIKRQQAEEIRSDPRSGVEIAAIYGVSEGIISLIRNGRSHL